MKCIWHGCKALALAEEWDIVHCDIKPANIMINRDGVVKLGDFGCSRVSEGSDAQQNVGGTLLYMSPEQITGEKLSHKSDIWSLGASAYEACTLSPVFANSSANSFEAVKASILHKEPGDSDLYSPELN